MEENNENPTVEKQTEKNADAEESISKERPEVNKDDKNMAMLCHLLAIFTSFLGPLIIWLIKKDDSHFIDDQGKEALNFQITVLIAMIISGLLTFACIGAILVPIVLIADLVFCIIAAVKTSSGERYRYPLTFRFIK